VSNNIMYQNNKSALQLEQNRIRSSSRRTHCINVRLFIIKSREGDKRRDRASVLCRRPNGRRFLYEDTQRKNVSCFLKQLSRVNIPTDRSKECVDMRCRSMDIIYGLFYQSCWITKRKQTSNGDQSNLGSDV
jgi:hypothetical protein